MKRILIAGVLAGIAQLGAAASAAGTASASPADRALATLADEYFDSYYFPENPTLATLAGIHRYDERLDDLTRAGVERQISALHRYETRFAAISPATLSEHAAGDRELLLSSVRSTLLNLETIRDWERNPDRYSSGISASAFSLMERQFASPAQRLRLVIARERQMPAALDAARENLRNPPAIFTSIALQQLPGDIGFFEHDLPLAFASVTEQPLNAQFKEANGAVIAALKKYEIWLRKDLAPRSHGRFQLGTEIFRKKLLYDEMVDTPLDQLLALGGADMRRNQAQFARVASEYEPGKTAQQVLADLAADYPPPQKLLESFRATFDGLIDFINRRQIITVPSTVRPILEETPPFLRATTFASMDTPGPYETVAQEAYFNVTLPEAGWDAAKIRGFMAQFNYPVINNVAVHEAYPGHYVQFLWMHNVEDRVRKLLGASSNAEGWAHYCEQMILDEGFGQPTPADNDPHRAQLLRLGQLQDALLRNARYMVAIQMHTGTMTFEQAIDYFVKEGYQSRVTGEVEAKRGTDDPTYLYYTLGKLQILKMREDFKAKEGERFTLRGFHDQFMQQGFPPIKIVRKALLHDDSPTL